MKTKVNEVPLVGPRGRRELLAKINELEEKVAELASNPPAPTDMAKVLTIPNFDGAKIEKATKEEFCVAAGITQEQFDALMSGEYCFVTFPNYGAVLGPCIPAFNGEYEIGFSYLEYNGNDVSPFVSVRLAVSVSDGYVLAEL